MFSIPCLRRHFRIRSLNPSSVIAMASFDSSNTNEVSHWIATLSDLLSSGHRQNQARGGEPHNHSNSCWQITNLKQVGPNSCPLLNVYHIFRPKTEPLGRSLERLRLSISNPKRKNLKRKEESMSEAIIQTIVALYPSESKEKQANPNHSNNSNFLLLP